MAKGMFIGVSGVARKTTEAYIGVSGVARKVKNGFIGVSGAAREFFVSGVVWNKYNAIRATGSYSSFTPSGTTKTFINAYVYPSYSFDSTSGFVLSYPGDWLANLGSNAVGYYYMTTADGDTYLQQQLYQVISYDSSSSSSPFTLKMIKAANANYTDGYEKGTTSYGTITVADGEQPEEGTIVEGSIDGDYCIINVSGTYYYYEKA